MDPAPDRELFNPQRRDGVTESELTEYRRGSMASYKKPRHIEFVTGTMPRIGQNLDYAALDAQFGGGDYPGSG
jgi:hypothetical protein